MNELDAMTVYDLGGSDSDVWLSENKRHGFDLEIENENGIYTHEGMHPFAAESLASFCRRYLHCYDRLIGVANDE